MDGDRRLLVGSRSGRFEREEDARFACLEADVAARRQRHAEDPLADVVEINLDVGRRSRRRFGVGLRLIASAGARVLRLPAYSPDLNPIEMAIAKIKALLRKLARRRFDDLVEAIGQAMMSISSEDASNFIRHCGYR